MAAAYPIIGVCKGKGTMKQHWQSKECLPKPGDQSAAYPVREIPASVDSLFVLACLCSEHLFGWKAIF